VGRECGSCYHILVLFYLTYNLFNTLGYLRIGVGCGGAGRKNNLLPFSGGETACGLGAGLFAKVFASRSPAARPDARRASEIK